MKTKHFSVIGAVILCMTMVSNAKAQSTVDDKENARVFVQKFYDEYIRHYTSLKNKERSYNAMPYMIKNKSQYFSDTLLTAFKQNEDEDYLLQPFLSRRERDKLNYQTGNVEQSGNSFSVYMHTGLINESIQTVLSTPAVIMVRVENVNNRWKLVNFCYLTNYDRNSYLQIVEQRKLRMEEAEKHLLEYSTTGKHINK